MKNPRWKKEEIILALNLYFDENRGSITSTNPKIIELSETINKLDLAIERKDIAKFRNPNGISLKLSNFLALDENYLGKGMESYSKLDEELFKKYSKDRKGLKEIANAILKTIKDSLP